MPAVFGTLAYVLIDTADPIASSSRAAGSIGRGRRKNKEDAQRWAKVTKLRQEREDEAVPLGNQVGPGYDGAATSGYGFHGTGGQESRMVESSHSSTWLDSDGPVPARHVALTRLPTDGTMLAGMGSLADVDIMIAPPVYQPFPAPIYTAPGLNEAVPPAPFANIGPGAASSQGPAVTCIDPRALTLQPAERAEAGPSTSSSTASGAKRKVRTLSIKSCLVADFVSISSSAASLCRSPHQLVPATNATRI